MSREVKVVAWCDGEHEHDEAAPGFRNLMSPEGVGGKVILDLCPVCDKEVDDLIEQLNAWLARGVPEAQAVTAEGSRSTGSTDRPKRKVQGARDINVESEYMRTCQDCGVMPPTRSALGQHVKQHHGKKLGDYTWSPR